MEELQYLISIPLPFLQNKFLGGELRRSMFLGSQWFKTYVQCWGKVEEAGLTCTPLCDPEEQQWVGLLREHVHIQDHRSHLQQWWTMREAWEDTVEDRHPECEAGAIQRDLSILPLRIRMDSDPILVCRKGNTQVSFSRTAMGASQAGAGDVIALLQFCKINQIRVCLIDVLVCWVSWQYRGLD